VRLEELRECTTSTDTVVCEHAKMSQETTLRMSAEERERTLETSMDAAINSEHEPSRMYPLVMRQGVIIRPDLNKETAVCVVANACGKTAYATSGVLEREYAHADLYRCRRRMFSTSRAITADRDRTGSIVVRSGDVGPTIIYLIAHFGPGKSLENNEIAMKQLRSSTDITCAG